MRRISKDSRILLVLLLGIIFLTGCTQQTQNEQVGSTTQIVSTSTTTTFTDGLEEQSTKEDTSTSIEQTTTTSLANTDTPEEDMEEIEYAEVYLGLREMALTSEAQESEANKPYAVLMEFHSSNGVVTLASFSAGDTSLYFSNGGLILGAGQIESVASASKSFVKDSTEYIQYAKKVTEFPHPEQEEVLFYIITGEGVYMTKDTLEKIEKGESNLTPLHESGNRVITEIRLQQEKQ